MIGVKPGVKNDLGYSFGLNGIDWKMARPGRLELPTLCLEGTQYKALSAAAGVAYRDTRHLSRS